MTSIETTSVSCSCYGTPTKSLIQHVRTFLVSSKLLCAGLKLLIACTAVTIFIIQWTNFQIYSYVESQHNFKKNSIGQILGPPTALGPRALHALHALLLRHWWTFTENIGTIIFSYFDRSTRHEQFYCGGKCRHATGEKCATVPSFPSRSTSKNEPMHPPSLKFRIDTCMCLLSEWNFGVHSPSIRKCSKSKISHTAVIGLAARVSR